MNSFDKTLAIATICPTTIFALYKIGWPALLFGAVAIASVALAKESGSHE